VSLKRLKMVDVDQERREPVARAAGLAPVSVQGAGELAPVGDSRERVALRQNHELFVGGLQRVRIKLRLEPEQEAAFGLTLAQEAQLGRNQDQHRDQSRNPVPALRPRAEPDEKADEEGERQQAVGERVAERQRRHEADRKRHDRRHDHVGLGRRALRQADAVQHDPQIDQTGQRDGDEEPERGWTAAQQQEPEYRGRHEDEDRQVGRPGEGHGAQHVEIGFGRDEVEDDEDEEPGLQVAAARGRDLSLEQRLEPVRQAEPPPGKAERLLDRQHLSGGAQGDGVWHHRSLRESGLSCSNNPVIPRAELT
jgi:hypothetical protein